MAEASAGDSEEVSERDVEVGARIACFQDVAEPTTALLEFLKSEAEPIPESQLVGCSMEVSTSPLRLHYFGRGLGLLLPLRLEPETMRPL